VSNVIKTSLLSLAYFFLCCSSRLCSRSSTFHITFSSCCFSTPWVDHVYADVRPTVAY